MNDVWKVLNTKFSHFVLIGQLTLPPEAILVSDWPIFKTFSSETMRPNVLELSRNVDWKILYKDSSFRADRLANIVATVAHSFTLNSMWNSMLTFFNSNQILHEWCVEGPSWTVWFWMFLNINKQTTVHSVCFLWTYTKYTWTLKNGPVSQVSDTGSGEPLVIPPISIWNYFTQVKLILAIVGLIVFLIYVSTKGNKSTTEWFDSSWNIHVPN